MRSRIDAEPDRPTGETFREEAELADERMFGAVDLVATVG
jgi:hypothetical protein